MSLLTGLLNKSCTVIRQPFKSDGQGGWIPDGSAIVVEAGVKILIDQKTSPFIRHVGGREIVATHTVYTEYRPEGTFQPNDMLTDVALLADPTQYDLDTVSTPEGVKTTRTIYQMQSPYDPNGERDHLESDIILYKGRRPVL